MPLTQLETDLRKRARDRIATGKLPNTAPKRMWGGNGTGRKCSLCDEPVREMELEFEEKLDGKMKTYRFHVLCQSLWQLECVREHHVREGLNPSPAA